MNTWWINVAFITLKFWVGGTEFCPEANVQTNQMEPTYTNVTTEEQYNIQWCKGGGILTFDSTKNSKDATISGKGLIFCAKLSKQQTIEDRKRNEG